MSFLSDQEISSLGFVSVGTNVLISRHANFYRPEQISIASNVRIDDFCILSAGDGGIHIGSNIHIGAYSSLIGKARISLSDYVNISSRVSIYSTSDDFSGATLTSPMISEEYKNLLIAPVSLCKHVIVGTGCVILPGVTLREGVAIGSLSLVKQSCDPFAIYAGVPAKYIKKRSKEMLKYEHISKSI